jgi:ubiquinone/menaquinone biosynthesis C-methylase UbiE
MPFRDESFDVTIISFALHDMPENIRAKVLREMKRVTKMGGKILVADYAAPPDGLVPRVGHRISNLFESKYYASFMKAGLNKYLTQAGLKPRRRYALLMGIAQLAVCNK